MSTHIENEVVSMQFDNKHFESNVKTSLSTLEKLKQSLKLHDAAKGFENVSAAAKKVNLNPLSHACDTVGLRFNALYTMADQAMRNITNSVQRTAANMIKAFTVDPIKTGFQEYETQINAVQTILANTQSKGTTLDDVNAALDTLNTYADKTIYNFTEMTRNIGTFTAAGVDLDTSVNAIQGIANLAAVSGSNAQQASTAMYQLSQALASGTVKLMDWNSVVNAGMGGQVFQDALKETARVHKVAIDDMIKKEGSFRETLKDGWLTSEILTETLQKFTLTTEGLTEAQIEQNRQMLKSKGYTDDQIDKIFELGKTATDAATKVKTFTQLMDTLKEAAQSGWTQTWEILIGDFEEAKNLWTGVSEIFNKFIEKTSKNRNDLLTGALDNSGWDKFIAKAEEAGIKVVDFEEAVKEVAKSYGFDVDGMIKKFGSLEKAVQNGAIGVRVLKEALSKVFGKKGQKQFEEYTVKADDALSELAKKWNTSVEEIVFLNKIKDPNLIITGQILKIPKAIEKAGDAAKNADENFESLAEALEHVRDKGGKELLHESIANAWKGLTTILKAVGDAWDDAFDGMTPAKLTGIIESIHEFSQKLVVSEETADKFKRTFKGIFSVVNLVADIVGGALKLAFGGFTKAVEILGPIVLSITGALGDFFSFLILKKDEAISTIGEWISKISELPVVKDTIADVKATFEKFFGPVTEGWKKFTELLKNPFTVDENGEKRLLSLSEVFENFKTNVVEKFKNLDFSGMFTNLADKIKAAFKSLFGGPTDEIQEQILPVKEAIETFKPVFETFDDGTVTLENFKLNVGEAANIMSEKFFGVSFDIEKVTNSVVGFFKKVGEVISENKGKIIALGTLIGILFAVRKVADLFGKISAPLSFFEDLGDAVKNFGLALKANAIKAVATGITMLVASLIALAFVPWQKLLIATGFLAAIAGILIGTFAALSFAAKKLGNVGDLGKVALTLLGLAGALLIFGLAAKTIGLLDWGTLLKTGVVLWAFTLSLKSIASAVGPGGGDLARVGSAFIGLAGALLIFAGAVAIFGSMDGETLLKGGAAVLVCMLLMKSIIKTTSSLPTVGEGGSILKIGGVFMAMATSLLLLAASVAIFGKMKTGTLIKGGSAVLAFMGIMILVMKATKNLLVVDKGSIVKVGGIFASMGAALLMMAASVAIFGTMKTSTLLKGGSAVLVLLGAMVGIMAATKLLAKARGWESFAKVGGIMLAFSASILILAGAIAILSFIKPADLAKGAATIAGIGVVFMGLIAVTRNIPAKSVGTIIALSAAVVILAGALIALTFATDSNELKAAGLALGGVIAMLALLTASTKYISPKAAVSVGVMGVIIAGLAYVIGALSDIPAKQALAASGAISLLIASLSTSLLLISKATKAGNIRLKNIGMMALALAAIGVVAGVLIGVGVAFLPTIGDQIKSFLDAVVPALGCLTSVDSSVISSIGTLFAAMGELASGAAKMAIADKFTGDKASGSFTKFTSWINEVIPIIKGFALDLTGVEINTENLDAVIGAVRDLAEAAALAPTMKAGAFASKWAAGAVISVPMLTEAKNWIVQVAPVVRDLAKEVSTKGVSINKNNLELVCDAATSLAEAAALAPSVTAAGGGFTSKWVTGGLGVISHPLLSRAASWITSVAPIIKDLATTVTSGEAKNLNKDNLDAICAGAKTLAEAAALAPSVDMGIAFAKGPWGFGGAFGLSHPMMSAAANWIAKVKDPIVNLAKSVGTNTIPDFKGENLTSIVTAVKTLCEAANAAPTVNAGLALGVVPKLGGFLAFGVAHPLLGPMATFIDEIEEPMSALAKSVADADMDEVDIDNFNAIMEAVADVASADYPTATGGGLLGIGGMLGFTIGFGASVPMITKIKDFITEVKDPIIALANATTTGLTEKFNKDNFNTITGALIDIAGANYPTTIHGGGAVVSFAGMLGAGEFYSSADVTAVKNFIVAVRTPIIELANATANGLENSFNKENFESITGAIVDIASAKFPTYNDADLKNFGLLTGFIDGKWVSGSDITAVKDFITQVKTPIIDLANAVSGTAGEDGTKLTDFKKDNFTTIVKAIVDLASAEYPGIESVKMENLSKFAKITGTAEQVTDFTGFVGFVDSIKEPIKNLATSVSGDVTIDSAKVGSVVDAIVQIAESSKNIPTVGGLKGFMEGKTDFKGFVEFLAELGPGFTALNTALGEGSFDATKVSAAATAVKNLALAADAIPDTGAWHDFWSGETGWDEFNTNIGKFGEGIKKFSDNVAGMNVEATSTATKACLNIATAFQYITATNWDILKTYIGNYTDWLPKLSEAINGFSDDVSGINVEAVSTASGAVSASVGALNTLQSISFDTIDTEAFKTKLGQLASGVVEFASGITTDPSTAITNVEALVGMLTTIQSTEFTKATAFNDALTSIASTSISDFVSQFSADGVTTSLQAAGGYLMDGVIAGVDAKIEDMTAAAEGVSAAGSGAILAQANYVEWKSAGEYVGSGFVAGISSKITDATNAGTALGSAALEAAKAALDENSPSKEFYKVGEFAGIGLVDALYEYERNTYKAGYGVGESAKLGLSDAIARVKSLIENGIDDQPTIRPVLDLSEITAGADGISSLFNMKPTVALAGNLGNISAMVDKNQNGGNEDVVAAINGLGNKLGETTGDSYNIGSITYDDSSNIAELVKALVRATLVGGRV